MIYSGLYHFSIAYDQGKANDPIKYFSAKENQDLGVVKLLNFCIQYDYQISSSPAPPASSAQESSPTRLIIFLVGSP